MEVDTGDKRRKRVARILSNVDKLKEYDVKEGDEDRNVVATHDKNVATKIHRKVCCVNHDY